MDLVPRLEYRIYLHSMVDYFDIILQLEQEFRQRFHLINERNGNLYILCHSYELLDKNQKWLEFCKLHHVDI